VTKYEWARPAPWMEVVARSGGRAKYNSIRKLRAKLRRLAIIRRLRHVGDIHQRGLQRQLAEELGVVASVICEDMKQILAAGGLGGHADGKLRGTRASRRPHQVKEDTMSQRCTVRLPDMIYKFVQIEADARQCHVSDLIREALERLLGLEADHSAQLPQAPEAVALSTSSSHDCVETFMTRLPMDVRENIVERARILNLPVSKVVTAMLITKSPPSQPSPQASTTVRPEQGFTTWQEFKRQRQQGSDPAQPGTSSSPAT
jgi:Arc/MetJ-type ribon-helix-helix transcriptional regulator